MSKYEIMLILDPSSNSQVAQEICETTFKSKDFKIEKLENSELAYKINKSKTAIYLIINVFATGDEIIEFTRKSNITKVIWRQLAINLDSEKGLNRKANPKKIKKPFVKKPFVKKPEDNDFHTTSNPNNKKPYIKKQKFDTSEVTQNE